MVWRQGRWPWATAGEQSPSGWGGVTPCSSCYCPERIAGVWVEEGNGWCCCQEGELCPSWLHWGSCSSSRAAPGFLWQGAEHPFPERGCRACGKGEHAGVGETGGGRGWISRAEGQEPRRSCTPGWRASSRTGSLPPLWGGRAGVIWKKVWGSVMGERNG